MPSIIESISKKIGLPEGDVRAVLEATKDEVTLSMETAGLAVINSYGWQHNEKVPAFPAEAIFNAMIVAGVNWKPRT